MNKTNHERLKQERRGCEEANHVLPSGEERAGKLLCVEGLTL